jgi:hypothetical protein
MCLVNYLFLNYSTSSLLCIKQKSVNGVTNNMNMDAEGFKLLMGRNFCIPVLVNTIIKNWPSYQSTVCLTKYKPRTETAGLNKYLISVIFIVYLFYTVFIQLIHRFKYKIHCKQWRVNIVYWNVIHESVNQTFGVTGCHLRKVGSKIKYWPSLFVLKVWKYLEGIKMGIRDTK